MSPWQREFSSTSCERERVDVPAGLYVRARRLHWLLLERLHCPMAGGAIDSPPTVTVPPLRKPTELDREHSGRQLAVAPRAMPVLRRAHLGHVPVGRARGWTRMDGRGRALWLHVHRLPRRDIRHHAPRRRHHGRKAISHSRRLHPVRTDLRACHVRRRLLPERNTTVRYAVRCTS